MKNMRSLRRFDVGAAVLCASMWLVLFAFWLLLSGYYTAFLLGAGAGSCAAVVWFSYRMGIVDDEGHPIRYSVAAMLSYWPWLAKEIVLSAWTVTKVVLHPRLPIAPTLVRFEPTQRSDLGLVIHANSITLTPGTISVEVGRRSFLVHALTRESAAGVGRDSDMDRRVRAMDERIT